MSYAKFGNTIAEFVRKFREEAHLTQKELADAMGVHPQYVSNVEGARDNGKAVMFCMRLKPHVDAKRQIFLDDLIEQALHDRVQAQMDTLAKEGKNAPKLRKNSRIR